VNNSLVLIGQRANARALSLSFDAQVELLKAVSGPWDNRIVGTIWFAGKRDTRDGLPFTDSLVSFADALDEYAAGVVAKGTGAWFTPAASANGRCRDKDIEWITTLGLDADEVGEWHQFIEGLTAAELAYLVQRSSGHREGHPKYHALIPTTESWRGEKWEWRQIYRHCVAWFSVLGGLRYDLEIPQYGFDLATDRMGQPWFLSARRTEEQKPPEMIWQPGNALDLKAFLLATGFEFCPETLGARHRTNHARNVKKIEIGSARTQCVLQRAFLEAGWLGPVTTDGTRAVLCPWRSQHSTGYDFDGSTVIFPPSPRASMGWFHCFHSHCVHRTQREVYRMLPPIALRRALSQKFQTKERS